MTPTRHHIRNRTTLLLAGLVAVLIEAAPLGVAARGLPSPDLVFCVVAVWALRVPEATPLLLVFGLGVVRDLVTDVPPGLGALALVLAAEALKRLGAGGRRQAFLAEWLRVAGAAAIAAFLPWLGLLLTLAQPAYPTLLLQQLVATVALYPLVRVSGSWLLRDAARKADPAGHSRPQGERRA